MSRSLFLACIAVAGLAQRASAGGFGIPEIGVRRTAMASIIGRPDDASSIYQNPAGLTLEHGWNVYVSMGLSLLSTEFQLAPWDGSDAFLGTTPGSDGYYKKEKPTRAMGVIPMIAMTGEILPNRLVLGLGVYVPNAQGAQFKDDATTRYHLIDGYVVAPVAVLAASYKINEAISIGGNVGVEYFTLKGKREVYPIINGSDVSSLTGDHPLLDLQGSGYAPTWMVAAFGHPIPRLTWGATITGRVDATLEGPVKVTYSADASTPNDVLEGRQKTGQMLPWGFNAGVNFDVTPNVEIGTEFRYWLYRQYEKQHTDVVGIFLVRELETIKNYHDSWQLSGGVRVHDLKQVPKLDLMMGTHYDRTPAPPTTVTIDQPTFNHVGLHMGARYSFGRYRIGASYIHYWYDIPTVMGSTTAPPSNFKGEGTNNIMTVSLEARL
ncbi:MAG TPA: outer membrane protein transport protein [Kofleriaceae bacterium]